MSESLLSGGDLTGLPDTGLIVVGFSGGADSTALAHWLMGKVEPDRIMLAHVNHMLRGAEGDKDEAAAGEFARRQGLRFVLLREDIRALAKESGQGLEECGRQVRYRYFESLATGENDRILTAHNGDDNAETMLLNLCRGASLQGLCGIPQSRGKILRPLLRVSRREIEEYCGVNRLSYVTDSSNFSTEYDRNKLRLKVMPVLKELNPAFVQAASQASCQLNRDREYLDSLARNLLERAKTEYGLEARVLREAHESLRSRALKLYMEESGCGRLESRHIKAAENILFYGSKGDFPGGVTAGCSQGVFYTCKEMPEESFSMEVGPGRWELPGGKVLILEEKQANQAEKGSKINNSFFNNGIDYDIITGKLVARTRREGDKFSPVGRKVSKSLKQLFQERRIPAPMRSGAVMLECGSELVYCQGVGVSRRFCVTENTKTLLVVRVLRQRDEEGN